MMLRARVAILADDPSTCLALGRSLPLLAWHRRRWEVLHPLCGLDEPEEVEDLVGACRLTKLPGGFGIRQDSCEGCHNLEVLVAGRRDRNDDSADVPVPFNALGELEEA